MAGASEDRADEAVPAKPRWRWLRRLARAVAMVVCGIALATAAMLFLIDTPLGHRFVVDRIAKLSPASGLRIRIGRVEGSLYGASTLRDIVISDPKGQFLTIPQAELDWRPLAWFQHGLDVRSLAAHRGHLLRAPALNPGTNPNAKILPDFDIRVDRLVFDDFVVDKALTGEARHVDLTARADIRSGRAIVFVTSRLGGKDRFLVHLDSEPDNDKFQLAVDYNAPKDGLLTALAGAKSPVSAVVRGKGGWSDWKGFAFATQGGKPLAALRLDNKAGNYLLAGQVHPRGMLSGLAGKAVGDTASLVWRGTFANKVLAGRSFVEGAAIRAQGKGDLDLARGAAKDFAVNAVLTRPDLVLGSPHLEGVRLSAIANGPFERLEVRHTLTATRFATGGFEADDLHQQGVLSRAGGTWSLPLNLTARKVTTGNAELDRRLSGGHLSGNLTLTGDELRSERLAGDFAGLAARLTLRGNVAKGGYALAGPVTARGFALTNLGAINTDAMILFSIGERTPWKLGASVNGSMPRIDNATLANFTGGNLRFHGNLSLGESRPILFRDTRLSSDKLNLAVNGQRLADGRTTLSGKGASADYGPFTVEAAVDAKGPNAVLVFADPLPAAGLKDVRVALSPIADGFTIETAGGSRLGPFEGTLGLFSPKDAPTRIDVQTFKVWKTAVTGSLTLGEGGASGKLALAGGGLNGTIGLAPKAGAQSVSAHIKADHASFSGPTPLSIGEADIDVEGLFAKGRSTLDATVHAVGIGSGQLFIGRFAANAKLDNGAGTVTASIAGRRGSRFELQGQARVDPDRIVALARGDFAGQRIRMPRRAVLTREDRGWHLAPTQVGYGRGAAIVEGHLGGGLFEMKAQLASMPLSLADIALADLGLGGRASGVVTYRNDGKGEPTGDAKLVVKGLTRSGLVFSSRPIDLALAARLDPTSLQAKAVMEEDGAPRGRGQIIVSGLPAGPGLMTRLRAGRLVAKARYNGPADALWRLTAVEVFDMTGTIGATSDVTGTIDDPVFSGSVASTDLRIQSALTGTDLSGVRVSGTFAGARLSLSSISGKTPNGGSVSGSGTVDLSDLITKGAALDLRIAAQNAQLLKRDGLGATVTGPLRIVSAGTDAGGTIAGRLRVEKANWALGQAAGATEVPQIATTEVNRPADIAPPRAPGGAWTYLIDATAPDQVDVRGLGLASDWSADIRLRGTTANPQIFGKADLVRGDYEFAGKRFELTKGRIRFFGETPPDPQLDIAATGDANGVNATINITGSALKPVITFTSSPALPEEELLSRLLFGSSITNISAPEAVQLAAALASLRGGSGLDPINKLRSAIGLDRLRIVGADPTINRGTAIAVGKYIGKKFYVELVTDGQGYSASSLEFRITRWLSLLSTISTIGDDSVNIKASKDY
ncbi:MAG: translocation/assembly module TamB domain-containing protein [Sphingomonadales bacterium]|nr:translocation/assembly module TamB domain-containing protein [Sphingomonadales bacterium]MDE2567607.1 translocation/assembly module TamB domain-containing protein [Sphingomonadales bacterium]